MYKINIIGGGNMNGKTSAVASSSGGKLRFTLGGNTAVHGAGTNSSSSCTLSIDNTEGIYKKATGISGNVSISGAISSSISAGKEVDLPEGSITFGISHSGSSGTSGYKDYSTSRSAAIELS